MLKIKPARQHVYSLLFSSFLLLLTSCSKQDPANAYESERLRIEQLSEHTFLHVSYLETEDYGKVACNGLIVTAADEAVVVDAPTNDLASMELIKWLETKDLITKAVIATHFHDDCTGGLKAFHSRKIPSFGHEETIRLARENDEVVPQNSFQKRLEVYVGKQQVITEFYGQGHTFDNVVTGYPRENVLFGGCLIKSLGAGKGYLGDANVKAWPETVNKIKKSLQHLEVVVPGHGKPGGPELLDYTIELFTDNK